MKDRDVPVITYPAERYKGSVEVSLLGEDGMHIRSEHEHPLTVNGVQVYFNVNMKEYDGEWELVKYTVRGTGGQYPDWSALTVRRVDNFEPASQSANKKVLQLAEDLAQYVAESRPDDVILGEIHRLRRQAELIADEKAKMKARLLELQEEAVVCALAIEKKRVEWATEIALQDNPSK